MRKKNNTSISLIIIGCLLLFSLFCVAAAWPQQNPNELFQQEENPDIVFEGVSFRYVSKGKSKWILKAEKGVLHKTKLLASLENIEWQSLPNTLGDTYMLLKAPNAQYDMNQSEIITQEPRSVLFLEGTSVSFKSSQFYINLKDAYLKSSKPVQLDYGSYKIQADDLFYDFQKNTMQLDNNFKMTYD